MNARIKSGPAPGMAVVKVDGDVDLDTCHQLQNALDRALDEGARHIVVNFIDSQYLDSTAFACLLETYRRMREVDARMALVIRDQSLIKLFHITGLDHLFELYEDEKQATGRIAERMEPPRREAM
jgi:anti-sigma B factor antagonist